jgi:multidrug resistance protein, MATE family
MMQTAVPRVSYREIFALAAPIMLANATTPLIGFVDTVVVGQLGSAALIGGVAMASVMFNAIYWGFGFLRMGTTGFTAQAAGARDETEVATTAVRALILAVGFGALVIILQAPLRSAFFWFLGGSPDVQAAARTYYDWRIWAAPAGLVNFALLGWFIGLGRTALAFWLQFGLNILNIVFAVLLSVYFGQGVAGVGAAAFISEWAAAGAGLAIVARELTSRGAKIRRADVLQSSKLRAMFAANRDILIRTACVLGAAQVFMRMSAAQGDVALAANALLLNILYIIYYLLDGYANAAETLVGQSIGANDRPRLDETVSKIFIVGGVTALLVCAVLWIAGPHIIGFMTPNAAVRDLSASFMPWAIVMPLIAVWCFVYDGVYIGATRTADMRNMMLVSFAGYLTALAVFVPPFGNHGVWAAHVAFFIIRAVTLRWTYPALAALAGPKRDIA